jgi:hypothetical protein
MPKAPFSDSSLGSDEPLSGDGLHDPPPELGDDAFDVVDIPRGDEPLRPAGATRGRMLVIGVVAAVTLAAGGLIGYRIHHRRAVLRDGLARAGALVRLDTAAGYRDAASLLEPLAQLDPLEAGAARAFALAMLAADYRDVDAGRGAEALLVEPMRADEVPARASAAAAALALGRREAGNAMTAAIRAGAIPEARVIAARVALLAGNLAAAADPLAAAAEAGAPAALALRGDVLRRTRQDLGASRAAYRAALSASPAHPRAAYGLAKLALAGHATPAEAEVALLRLLSDAGGTPAPERGRAALHLASLRLRAGDRARAEAALDAAGLDATSRGWTARAAAVAAARSGPYRAVEGAPAAVRSASDDDPPVLAAVVPAAAAPATQVRTAAPRPVVKHATKQPPMKAPTVKRPQASAASRATAKKQPASVTSTRAKRAAAKRPTGQPTAARR